MAWCWSCWETCSLWGQVVKAYKYMCEILSVTHTCKNPADGTRKPSKMDISRLEEQYYCITQRQKQQTHIVVFKAGENEFILGEPIVNTVPVNEKAKKQKAFKDQIPVKDVTLEGMDNNYLQDHNSPWHAYLNIHHMVQQDCSFALQNCKAENEKLPTNDVGQDIKASKLSSSTGDTNPISSLHRKSSLRHTIPASWTHHQYPSLKLTSPADKICYYPFPQKKSPRISETARKLGLYVTH